MKAQKTTPTPAAKSDGADESSARRASRAAYEERRKAEEIHYQVRAPRDWGDQAAATKSIARIAAWLAEKSSMAVSIKVGELRARALPPKKTS